MNYEQARFNMIEQQIRPWEVLDSQVLSLLALVRREDFLPTALRAMAFTDMEIPLTAKPGQTMLAPKVEARILQDLAVQRQASTLRSLRGRFIDHLRGTQIPVHDLRAV